MERAVADDPADVGRGPVVAGLDEEVVEELLDVLLDDGALAGEHGQERAQRLALVGVAHAVDGRQKARRAPRG